MSKPLVLTLRREWSADEEQQLREFYRLATTSRGMHLQVLADRLGRDKANVARKARTLGLTNRRRPKTGTRRLALRTFETDAERSAAASTRVKARLKANGHPRGFKGGTHSPEAGAVMGAASKAFWKTLGPEARSDRGRANQVTRVQRNPRSPSTFGPNPYSRAKRGKRADLGDIFFRSKWEANYARYLNWLQAKGEILDWQYEPDTYVFHGVTRGVLTYTPDFRVTERDGRVVRHEVKGWMDAKSKAKLKRMAKFYPEIVVIVIGPPEYRALTKWAGLIAGWEK